MQAAHAASRHSLEDTAALQRGARQAGGAQLPPDTTTPMRSTMFITNDAVPAEELDHRQYEGEPGGAAEED